MRKAAKTRRILALTLLCSLFLCITAYGNWKNEGGQWHYYDSSGQMVRNDFKKSGNSMFYLDETGNIARNCEKVIGNYLYQFDADGKFTRSKLGADGQPEYLEGDYALNHRQQYLNKKANPYNDNQVIQWFNATYAILTKHNSYNIRAYGGELLLSGVEGEDDGFTDDYIKEKNRKMLSESWGSQTGPARTRSFCGCWSQPGPQALRGITAVPCQIWAFTIWQGIIRSPSPWTVPWR